ncbi:DUF1653 domain-containing protein [Candidatus Woesearchaeota archaeon]|nr:DUF1653 domain-containing protein [Candidatus Woesearchaeota archaeon]
MRLGKYKHFKGAVYEVVGVAKHSETREELVVYKKNDETWARPKEMFLETISRDGKKFRRFEYLGESVE